MRKNQLKLVLFAFALGLGLSSCHDDVEPIYESFALLTKQSSTDYAIKLDNGTFVKLADDLDVSDFADSTRLVMQYHIISSVDTASVVDLLWCDEVLSKPYMEYSEEVLDSIGSDPLRVSQVWFAHDYLNVRFLYDGEGNKAHMINLLNVTPAEDGSLLTFELRHNAVGECPVYRYSGVASFKIQNLLKNVKGEVNIKIKYVDSVSSEKTITVQYDKNTDK